MADSRTVEITPLESLPRFSTIGVAETTNLLHALQAPLSGYLGGIDNAGYWVEKLSADWCAAMQCKYAIPCNSATSGLLAACMAVGIGPGDIVWTTAYSMSATAACAKVLGATIVFIDIETIRFSMSMDILASSPAPLPKCIIVTNLFGHPAYLATMRSWCDSNKVWMIEDAAQSPFAMEDGRYAGTVGHIGVFSFNVHKHLQCGEGGIIVTDDADRAAALAGAINHGELAGHSRLGLNLRMTEPTAAIACAQVSKAEHIISTRIELAEEITEMFADIRWIRPMRADAGCRHVYYKWVALVINGKRDEFVSSLKLRGFPMDAGYTTPLNGVFKSDDYCPVAWRCEVSEIIGFDICAYSPRKPHMQRMREIIRRVAGGMT